jgi:hypothetical protein
VEIENRKAKNTYRELNSRIAEIVIVEIENHRAIIGLVFVWFKIHRPNLNIGNGKL